jgi:uncharacterized protein (DUF927 family)
MVVIEIIVKGILSNKQKYKNLFAHMRDIVSKDLSNHVNKNKDEALS